MLNKILKSKRRGASMLTLMVFFFAALVITAQVFFFSNISAESVREDRDIQSMKMQLDYLVETTRIGIKDNPSNYEVSGTPTANWKNFFEETKNDSASYKNDVAKIYVNVHDLDYTYESKEFKNNDDEDQHWTDLSKRIFPAMKDHFLIRAYRVMPAGNYLMLQVLVNKNGAIKTYEEIWW